MRGVYQVIGDIGKYLVYKLVYEPVHKQVLCTNRKSKQRWKKEKLFFDNKSSNDLDYSDFKY